MLTDYPTLINYLDYNKMQVQRHIQITDYSNLLDLQSNGARRCIQITLNFNSNTKEEHKNVIMLSQQFYNGKLAHKRLEQCH